MPIELTPAPVPVSLGELTVSLKQYTNPVTDTIQQAWTETIETPVLDQDGNPTEEVTTETVEHPAVMADAPRYGTVGISIATVDADGNRVGVLQGDTADLTDAEKQALIEMGEAFRQRAASITGLDPR